MRYFRFRWHESPGGEQEERGGSWWYDEFDSDGAPIRLITLYDGGIRLRYDRNHLRDESGEFAWDVKLEEMDLSQGEEFSRADFDRLWQSEFWTNRLS